MRFLPALAAVLVAGPAVADPPVASYLFPAGGRRGTTVPVRVGGLNLYGRCGFALAGRGLTVMPILKPTARVWFEGPLLPLPESQQPEDYPTDHLAAVTIDPAAALGPARGRLWTSQGAAGGLVFVVGDLPEVVEQEHGGDPVPVPVTLPVTVNGRIFPREDLDVWSVRLSKGQTVSALATTVEINSPLAARLDVTDAGGTVLAEPGPHPPRGADAAVRFTAPADGVYHVRVRDARNLGGPAYVYRLTLTDGPVVDRVYPLGGRVGETVAFRLAGQAVPRDAVRVALPPDGSAPWHARLDLDDLPEYAGPPSAPLAPPAVLNGRLGEPGQRDDWKLSLEQAKSYQLALRARRLGSPLCGVVEVLDAAGRSVARAEGDYASDPELTLRPPADGVFTVRVTERFSERHGPAFSYRLRVSEAAPAAPDFRLRLAAEVVNVPRGGTAKVKVTADRLGGFDGPIEVAADGLPDGVTAAKVEIPKGRGDVEITFAAERLARVATADVRVAGAATVAGKPVRHTAPLLAAVAVPTPFKFTGEYTMRTAPRGQPYRRSYKLERNGFDGPVEVRLADRQVRHLQGVTAVPVSVSPGRSEFAFAAQLPPWIELGRTCRVTLTAVGTVRDPDGTEHAVCFTSGEQNHQMIVVPEPGRLGLELAAGSALVAAGEEVRVPFRLARAAGLVGPATVESLVPPHWRGLSAAPVVVPADRSDGVLVLRAGRGPLPLDQPVTVRATVAEPGGPVVAEAKLDLVRRGREGSR